MNCKECRRYLEDFHDGELAEDRAARVGQHLHTCAACAGELEVLKSEQELFERYRTSQAEEAAVSAPKWASVSAGIARLADVTASQDRSARRGAAENGGWLLNFLRSPLIRQVAFALVLVALSIAGTLIFVNRNRPDSPGSSALSSAETSQKAVPVAGEADGAGLESAMRAVRRAEQEYLQAIRLLSEVVNRRKPSLDPRLVMEVERNLVAIDESIAATRRAYYERPSDPELGQYMLAAYSKKVELLQELAT